MENLSLDEIIYITRFLNVKNTFNFLKSLKWNLNHDLKKSITIKNKKKLWLLKTCIILILKVWS